MSRPQGEQDASVAKNPDRAQSYEPKLVNHSPDDRRSSIEKNVNVITKEGPMVNASGHKDQMQRQYGLYAICGLALTIDNAWVAFGGSLSVAVLNGGPPGILYEFIVACIYYSFIGASIAELASAIPSSGGVFHWGSITPGPEYGRVVGFFTGILNFFGKLQSLAFQTVL
nr:choline transport protein [Quercus suber]